MKKILVALNYDPQAQQIAETGYALAKGLGAELTLLHVVIDPVFYSTSAYSPIMGFNGYMNLGQDIPDIELKLENASKEFLGKVSEHLGDKNIRVLVMEGDVAECILDTAKTMSADCIVMGHQSRSWLNSIGMQNAAEKVLHESDIPVFIIPIHKMQPDTANQQEKT